MSIAQLTRTRGNKGELAAVRLSGNAERAKRVFAGDVALEVERVWVHGERLVFKFVGIDSISDAEKFEGTELRIPLEERAALPPGEYYQSDLIGCRVVELKTGRDFGVVEDWLEYGGPPLLQIKSDEGKELLIPFALSICLEIDAAGKRIGVELPEGLDEL